MRRHYLATSGVERQRKMKISYNKLWKILIDKDMKKADLRKLAKISSNTIAKLGKNETVRMDILLKIATALGCKVEDLFETIFDDKID